MLALHIIAALTSLVCAAAAWVRPSVTTLRATYGLIAVTVLSGTYLIVTSPAHMAQTCLTGLGYLGLVLTAVFFARRRLELSRSL
jgi:hypothetical protein